MRERFSTPEQFSRGRARQEIDEGIAEYLASPRSKEGLHIELADTFELKETERPLTREEVEKEIEGFVGERLADFLPMLLQAQLSQTELICRLGITNEHIGLLGVNYYIREHDGELAVFETDECYPEGREVDVGVSDLLALVYAKENIRVDTKRETGRTGGEVSHRYFLKSKNRYLCANDFGMRVWDEKENRLIEGDITNATPFVQTVKQQVERMRENFSAAASKSLEKTRVEMRMAAAQAAGVQYLSRAESQALELQIFDRVSQELVSRLAENPKDQELILSAVPARKVQNHTRYQADRIAKKYGLSSGNPVRDYEMFERNAFKLNQLLREPTESERESSTIDFVYSDFFRKPVIIGGNLDRTSVVRNAHAEVRAFLARQAADSDTDEVRKVFGRFSSRRGPNSPYFYADNEIYDFIKTVGAERVAKVLSLDDRDVFEQLTSFSYLKAMKYDFASLEDDQLKKQLHHAHALLRSGLWDYLEVRNKLVVDRAREKLGAEGKNKHWLELVGTRAARSQFYEGKRMYWLAKQVYIRNPQRRETDRFYYNDANTDWERYDLSKADVPEGKLNEYLDKQRNLIVALLGQENKQHLGEEPSRGKPATLGLIISALEHGRDIRGVALAHDKQRYLEGVISRSVKDDLTFAIEDWPQEWREAVSQDEINLYYEYASDYVVLDPDGLTKYAAWRASAEGKEWGDVFKDRPERKADLDFRICLGAQTEEVRGWYKGAAEHVGGTIMQNYLLRFNTTRGGDGRIANWHDVLLWSPHIQKIEAGDARSILQNIETMDDNQEFVSFLPRYSAERDSLKENGPIQSLRELKKRIFAIESSIDLSQFPQELLEITSAPGFNLIELENMRRRADFQDLFEGKLDAEQPFRPHSRVFAGRALTEALREGLGSQRQKIRGTATDPKGFFHALNQLVKDREIEGKKMTALDLLNSVPTDLEEDVIRLLREQRVDVGPTVEAQIHAKSDPEGWVCGNYTDCCMSFGEPNNTNYMFNRATQYFTIKYNGRIVAQSVVVDGRDRESREDVVILDNIEVANNYIKLSPLLAQVYQTFWTEYTGKPVKVGTGYSDLIPPGSKLEQNRYEAKTHLPYSDAAGSQIYDLPKLRGVESMDKVITFANLSERDAELIAKMEAETYPEGIAQGKAYIADVLRKQRELEVPGAASSFVVRQGQEVAGYLLVLPEESEVSRGERVAHIYDMVVLPKFRGSIIARKMMERTLDIASAYGFSIEAEARANTSYALLMNERIRRWFERKGFFLTKNEKLPAYMGGEDFYFVRFENRQNTEVIS